MSHRSLRTAAVVLVLLLGPAAGCSGGAEESDATTTTAPTGAELAALDLGALPDPCSVLTADVAQELTGIAMEHVDIGATPDSVPCFYRDPAGGRDPVSISITVYGVVPGGPTVAQSFAAQQEIGGDPVPTLGRRALYYGDDVVNLVLVDLGDDTYFVTASVVLPDDPAASRDRSIDLARRYVDAT